MLEDTWQHKHEHSRRTQNTAATSDSKGWVPFTGSSCTSGASIIAVVWVRSEAKRRYLLNISQLASTAQHFNAARWSDAVSHGKLWHDTTRNFFHVYFARAIIYVRIFAWIVTSFLVSNFLDFYYYTEPNDRHAYGQGLGIV